MLAWPAFHRQGVFDPLVAEVRQQGEAAALRNLDAAAFATHLFDLGAPLLLPLATPCIGSAALPGGNYLRGLP